ncbi:MAG: radical SAM protein [Spirochaetaceae bacterium]|nr:radical SAM protein [Spirochaetaceae bacterium]
MGISLGVDLLPHKTCTLNCVYCECGETTDLTTEIREYVSTDGVIDELKEYLDQEPSLDVITFSGAGEPTLHRDLGKIIAFIKDNYNYRVTVLTNSTLLWRKDVRNSLLRADLVVPSIDTVTEEGFGRLLRCHKDITPALLIDGLEKFCRDYKGEIILEVFVAEGINDSDYEIDAVIDLCKRITFNGLQINSLDRPGAESWVKPLSEERLRYIYLKFQELGAEIIGVKKIDKSVSSGDLNLSVINLISRRPATLNDLSVVFGLSLEEIEKSIKELKNKYNVEEYSGQRGVFYRIKPEEL